MTTTTIKSKKKLPQLKKVDVLAAQRELCKRSFYNFIKIFWQVVIKDKPVWNWSIKVIADELQKVGEQVIKREPKLYDLVINIPPGQTKSTVVTVMFPAWLWMRDPTLRIINGSNSGNLAMAHSTKSRDIIQSEKFKLLFSEIKIRKDQNNKTLYENTKGGTRESTSVGGIITGKHADVLIIDDPIDPTRAESPTGRKAANDWISKTLETRKVSQAVTVEILVMQRLHMKDPTAMFLERGDVRHICLPAELSEKVRPVELKEKYVDGLLDTVRLSRKVLEHLKTTLGTLTYNTQMQQRPAAPGGNKLKEEWFEIISREQFRAIYNNETINFDCDSAYGEDAQKKKAKGEIDYNVIIVTTKIKEKMYVINVSRNKMEFNEYIKYIPKFLLENGYTEKSKFEVEPKASGKSIVSQLKNIMIEIKEPPEKEGDKPKIRLLNLNVKEGTPPKDNKLTRVDAISVKVETGKVVLVEGQYMDGFISECTTFPNDAHDDQIDTLVMAINRYWQMGEFKPFILPW